MSSREGGRSAPPGSVVLTVWSEQQASDWIDAWTQPNEGYSVFLTCSEECEGQFSWSPCDTCGSTLGVDRHPVAWLERERAATWAALLDRLPTICTGQAADLKVDTGDRRVWLARTSLEDGEPFPRTVYVEELTESGWADVGYFDGDETEPKPWGAMSEAWTATLNACGAVRS